MKKLAKVFHAELFGKRDKKYKSLEENDISSVEWKELKPVEPYYFFVPKDFEAEEEYKKGFGITDLMQVSNSGIKTDRDALFIDDDKDKLIERIKTLLSGEFDELFRSKYRVQDSGSYKITQKIIGKKFDEKYIQKIQYRPFDFKWIYYDPTLISRPAQKAMKHIISGENICLICCRQFSGGKHFVSFISNKLVEISSQPFAPNNVFPLYLYNPDGTKTPNLNPEIVEKIFESVETNCNSSLQRPEQILDYIYAILHSPAYREKYKEFLKIDFPRIPYPDAFFCDEPSDEQGVATPCSEKKELCKQGVMTPCSKSKEIFEKLIKYGKELRELHLLQSPKVNEFITTFPESGTNTVEKGYPKFVDQKIYINEKQYFGNVLEVAWNFYIGGYQPAQKWLKDRLHVEKNNHFVLQTEDIEHYQKMIVSLTETDKIMKEIDTVIKL